MLTANDTANVKNRLIPDTRVRGFNFNYDFEKVGGPAPDFELPAMAGERQITMRSRDYRGARNLVVTFHPPRVMAGSSELPNIDALLQTLRNLP
jgi:hypothetical protein